eukprot:TRINITY_DN65178_c0_g1_i2.p1 TRINITY_DN65178_c0_g1~~TRINITY_DN65178_c0_g1_i2.p1  ORF type:complete len:367 (+),score=32.23 TRINITY_DN65178_c0_g1_i2:427-1527(+)
MRDLSYLLNFLAFLLTESSQIQLAAISKRLSIFPQMQTISSVGQYIDSETVARPICPGSRQKNPTTLKLLEDLGNFVNLEKAKHIFVVFMGENGIQEDRLKDVSELLRKTADQEPKHIERYAALKEGADLKKMISFDGLLSALINHYVNIRVKEIEHFKASFQILDTGSEFIINFEEYANAVKRAQPKRSERWIEQTFHFLKESRGYEAISANDAISRLVPWLGDSLSVGIWKVDSPENITNELHPIKKGEKKVVTTKLMKDPLTNIFMLDQTFKIMKQVLLSVESQKNEQSKALEQIKLGTQNLISQFVSGDFTYSVSSDPTVEIWKRFRRFLEAIQSKQVNLICLLYTSPSPRDLSTSRMPSSA